MNKTVLKEEKEQIKKIASSVLLAAINSFSMPVIVFLLGVIVWGGNQFYIEYTGNNVIMRGMQVELAKIGATVSNVERRTTRIENTLDKGNSSRRN